MLVIPRKQGESVVLDGDIVVTVLEIRGDRVRFGIEYPDEKGVTVHREEFEELLPVGVGQPRSGPQVN